MDEQRAREVWLGCERFVTGNAPRERDPRSTLLALAERAPTGKDVDRYGGGTLADAIHRMEASIGEKHAENQQDIAELRATAELNGEQLRELHRIAGQAAMRAASADERVQQADQRVRQIAADVDVLTDAALADHAHIWEVLSELGYDRRGEPDAP